MGKRLTQCWWGFIAVLMFVLYCLGLPGVALADPLENDTGVSENSSSAHSMSSSNAQGSLPSTEAPVDRDDAQPDANRALLISLGEMTTQDANTYSSDRNSTSIPWANRGDFSRSYVFDLAGLFTASQYEELREQAQTLADMYQMGVYLLTTDYMNGLANPTSSQRTAYATGFYKQYGLGLGADHNGILLVIAADSRDYVTVAYGQGSYSFDDAGIEKMEDAVTDHLSDNEWYDGACAYYNQMGAQLAYYARHGEPGSPLSAGEWAIRIALIVIIPLVIALGVILRQRSEMKPVRLSDEASDYLDPNSLIITAATDTFITTNLVVTSRASSEGSGSGSGSGGGWGGGGGGSFSSSGGGKF